MARNSPKTLIWVGGSRDAVRAFPGPVRETFGFAIFQAQLGAKHVSAKPMRGFGGAGVLEVVEDHDGDTYRAVYTVKFLGVVYVLHAFQKKSKRGIATPAHEISLIRRRLQQAAAHYQEWRHEQESNEA